MRSLRRRAGVIGLLLSAALAIGMLSATPAQAAVVACAPHTFIASHTTSGGNDYLLQAHMCGDRDINSSNARAHWHCSRNGFPWDGCRINTELLVQYYNNGWLDAPQTSKTIANPGGSYNCSTGAGFFIDSTTSTSHPFDFVDDSLLRGAAKDPDNMRFCLADGSTVVKDVTNSVSLTWTHI